MSTSAKSTAANDRKLKIQIGVCKRLVKEVAHYEAEVLTNEARVQKMRDDGKDVYGESFYKNLHDAQPVYSPALLYLTEIRHSQAGGSSR